MQKKNFVLDTNVLLHDPEAIFHFQEHDVCIPIVVIEEVDTFKKAANELGRNAREVSRHIDKLRLEGSLVEGVNLPNGGVLRVVVTDRELPSGFRISHQADNRIMATALHVQEQHEDRLTILVTLDTSLRIRANALGLEAEDYDVDRITLDELYPGTTELELPPGQVSRIFEDESVALPEESDAVLVRDFPLAVGARFTRAGYSAGAARYAAYLAAHGYPEARVDQHARVDVPGRCAEVAYRLEPGPFAVFGPTRIEGVGEAAGEIARREIAYVEGRPFDLARLEATQVHLRDTRLFSLVRIDKEPVDEKGEVPLRIELHEGPPHEIRFGVGYGTDDGIRGTASWWNYDFLGGNRRLGFSAKVSRINRWVEASFAQPHFPGVGDLASVAFTLGQQDESTYLDNGFLLAPRIDWKISERLVLSAFYAWRYDSLSDVSDATIEDLGPPDQFQNVGFTSSVGLNLRWNNFDDFANPTRGIGIGLTGEVSGGPLGADFDLLRVIAQATYYRPLFGDLILALGARGGSVVPFDRTSQVPLWSRLYAGGNALFPVRGYGRRRVGPLSGSDDPLGGRSVVVGTVELLYPVFGPVQGVVFADTGDVELSAWTLRPENFQTGVGFGFRASTPVGPVSIDFGFGLDRPTGDSMFHLDLMIGPRF